MLDDCSIHQTKHLFFLLLKSNKTQLKRGHLWLGFLQSYLGLTNCKFHQKILEEHSFSPLILHKKILATHTLILFLFCIRVYVFASLDEASWTFRGSFRFIKKNGKKKKKKKEFNKRTTSFHFLISSFNFQPEKFRGQKNGSVTCSCLTNCNSIKYDLYFKPSRRAFYL